MMKTTDPQAKVGVLALGWTVTGIAIVLTITRYIVRVRMVNGLKLDDLLHGLALIGAITFMVINTYALKLQFLIATDLPYYERLVVSSSLLGFVVVIYLVKFSFLVMYRGIFEISRSFMLAWKLVCVFNGVCFLAGFLAYFWLCGSPYQTVHPEICDIPLAGLPRTISIMVTTCLFNSLSSIAVIALPLSMLRKLHVRTSDKLGLAAVFLLAIADMMFDVTRTITTLKGVSSVLEAMASLEPAMAVIASALAGLGPLFRYRSRKRLNSYPTTGERKLNSYPNTSDAKTTPSNVSGSNNPRSQTHPEEGARQAPGSGCDSCKHNHAPKRHDENAHRWAGGGGGGNSNLLPPPMTAVRANPTSPVFPPVPEGAQDHTFTTRVDAQNSRRTSLPSDQPPPSDPAAVQRQTEVRIEVSPRYSNSNRTAWYG